MSNTTPPPPTGSTGTTADAATTATTADAMAALVYDVNQHWMIYAGSLVFFMQAGFSLLEAGSVSAKNTTNILFKNLLDACVGALSFYAIGYAFAYGDPNKEDAIPTSDSTNATENGFIGTSNFFLTAEDGKTYRSFFFQWAFAATAATIVSGAVAERIRLPAYFIYSFVVTAIIYPPVVHWAWDGDGFMCNWHEDVATNPVVENSMNFIDFAGSGVVHLTGGICALVGAIFAGPRMGRFPDKRCCGCFTLGDASPENVVKHEPHNRVYAALGTLILWFGWYGFNAGSTLDISGYGVNASRVAVTTTLAAASGAVVSMIISMITTKPRCRNFDVMAPLNGILAGLVSITAGCNVTSPEGSVGIGLIGGGIYCLSSWLLKVMRIDDPIDAFSVHGACGIWGVLAVGIFGVKEYICGDDSDCVTIGGQLAMQLVGVLCIIGWTAATSTALFAILRFTKLLRASGAAEIQGLDKAHHLGFTGVLRYEDEMKGTTDGLEEVQRKGTNSKVTPNGPLSKV